ncbi:hypothetical protein BEH_07340 [Priestia filamentosa]|uniref:HTH cro/C1-type domain-containing protein n=1 Tax=Priestia filamentosa TaxID=1402861 RepID=A0A0H4KE86_9BACI|nr:helix-turn-helix transcriptional regulator [Priestia filamentosa]AKO91930.1 hypothetical protein BEH_07340 [Priestia filamentosa]
MLSEYKLKLDEKQAEKIKRLTVYENFRRELIKGEELIEEEDIIYAAVNFYLNSIETFYKINTLDDKKESKTFLKLKFKDLLKESKTKIQQKDIAKFIGVDTGHISQVLNNKTFPSLDVFLKLWVFFGSPPLDKVIELKNN